MTKRFGFTLAEVLITLGIIGVVAAMTMPTLINQTNGAQYKAAYKKALSAISQAVTLNVALEDVSFAEVVADTNPTGTDIKSKVGNNDTIASLLDSRMNIVNASRTAPTEYSSQLKTSLESIGVVEEECNPNSEGCPASGKKLVQPSIVPNGFLYFNDGSTFIYQTQSGVCTKDLNVANGSPCYGYIDVNGPKGPNKIVACDSGTGTTGTEDDKPCTLKSPTDIYPVVFFDQTILPASNAAKAVLYGK